MSFGVLGHRSGTTAEAPDATDIDIISSGNCILLVEDQTPVRLTLERALSRYGYAVSSATSAAEARELFVADAPDLLLSDVALGGGADGAALLSWARGIRPELPAVLMSGQEPPLLLADLAADGGVRFLAKPFSIQALLTALRGAMADFSAGVPGHRFMAS